MTAPVSLADVRLAHDGMTQHECSRVGCTRLTSEQECALHAAEPAGVIHEAKEPRSAPTLLTALADALARAEKAAAERDEWKRRAEALGYQGGR